MSEVTVFFLLRRKNGPDYQHKTLTERQVRYHSGPDDLYLTVEEGLDALAYDGWLVVARYERDLAGGGSP